MTDDTAAALAALSARVRELEDRAAIAELTARYNAAFDGMDVDGWVGTFTADGAFELEHPRARVPETVGHARLRQMHETLGFGTVHLTSDHEIEVDGDAARQRCTALLAARTAELDASAVVMTGRYRDELVRTPDGWRFARRVWIPDADMELPDW